MQLTRQSKNCETVREVSFQPFSRLLHLTMEVSFPGYMGSYKMYLTFTSAILMLHGKGTSENQHKLICRFIPKGKPISEVSEEHCMRINNG